MNIAGCDFLCQNNLCKNFNTKITLHAPWPMAYIHDMINAYENIYHDYVKYLKTLNSQFALIIFPDIFNLNIAKFRITKYCENCKLIVNFEIEPENYKKEYQFLHKCICENNLLNLSQAVENNLNCTLCNSRLIQHKWISKS